MKLTQIEDPTWGLRLSVPRVGLLKSILNHPATSRHRFDYFLSSYGFLKVAVHMDYIIECQELHG